LLKPHMKKLENRIALITGAGRGIGMATAVQFAREGADLILISRTADELSETANLCLAHKVNVFTATVDLAEKRAIDHLFENLPDDFARIGILINNAARFIAGRIDEFSFEDFQSMLQTNLIAPYYLSQKVIRIMKNNSGGNIINISTYSGLPGAQKFPEFGIYGITKYALWGLTEYLAVENREFNIRVNQLSPSGVDTRMYKEASPPGIPPDLSPTEVARQILYLASDDSFPLSGANITLEGMPDRQDEDE